MTIPTLAYSVDSNGKRIVSVDGVGKFNTNNTAAPSGTHDVKTTPAGVRVISIGGNLHEPLDIASFLNKV